MIKKLWPHARPYGKWIAAGVLCSALEAVFELLIPLVMSDIVDIGIKNADQGYILRQGGVMVAMAMVSLALGLGRRCCPPWRARGSAPISAGRSTTTSRSSRSPTLRNSPQPPW